MRSQSSNPSDNRQSRHSQFRDVIYIPRLVLKMCLVDGTLTSAGVCVYGLLAGASPVDKKQVRSLVPHHVVKTRKTLSRIINSLVSNGLVIDRGSYYEVPVPDSSTGGK